MSPRHKLEIKALGMDWCAARVFLTLNYSFALSSKWGSNVVDHKKNLILQLLVVIIKSICVYTLDMYKRLLAFG